MKGALPDGTVFFLGGTSDARELAVALQSLGYDIRASVTTDSGAESLNEAGISTRVGRLTLDHMALLLQEMGARALVDASHPFAEEAHRTAMAAATKVGIPYIRYERRALDYSQHPGIILVDSYEEAAERAARIKGSIMLTTGAKTLAIFARRLIGDPDIRLVIRMLPRADNLKHAEALGFSQKNIVGMQGPFSRELNQAFYRHFDTTVVITKESGDVGSVAEKVETALEMGIHVIVINRPAIEYQNAYTTIDTVVDALTQHLGGML